MALRRSARAGECSRTPGMPRNPSCSRVASIRDRRSIGPFDVELISMSHSIPEPSAVVIRTPLGAALHTGDWKLDENPLTSAPTDAVRLKALGEDGLAALICDSTNAVRDGVSPSEADVAVTLARLIREARQRVAVTTFASNVARIGSVANAARAAGRELVVHVSPGTPSMQTIWVLMAETGFIEPPFQVVKSYRKNERRGRPPVVPVEVGLDTFYKVYKASRPTQVASEDQGVVADPAKFRSARMRTLFAEARRFAHVVGIGLEGDAENGDRLAR